MHDATAWKAWNPITGCTKISEGCLHCYAERMAGRLCLMGQAKYKDGFRVTCHEAAEREQRQAVGGFAALPREQTRSEPEGKLWHAQSALFGDPKMSEFMDENRTAEKKQHPENAPKISEKFHKADHSYGEYSVLKGNVNRKGIKNDFWK